jgi:phage-related minor tail protein
MNEELKIVISADTKGANDNIKKTKEEIKGLKEQSEKTTQYVEETVSSITKGVAVALASVTALVAGMTALANKALENQKNFAKLNTTFANIGGSAKQAQQAYTGLYRFLGDADTATEAAALLAQITTEEQELAKL